MRTHRRNVLERIELGPEQAWPLGAVVPYTAPHPVTVANSIPAGFDRYVRIFHPFRGDDPAVQQTWSALAYEFGLVFHHEISPISFDPFLATRVDPDSVPADTPSDDGRLVLDGANVSFWTVWPDEGELIDPARSRLLELLVGAAPGGRAFFYWGLALLVSGDRPCLLRGNIETFGRDEALIREEFELAGAPGPEMIWPEDQSFLVVTGYDLASTYIGCSSVLADRLVADDVLEAVDTDLGARVDWGSDQINSPSATTPTSQSRVARSLSSVSEIPRECLVWLLDLQVRPGAPEAKSTGPQPGDR